MKLIKDNINLIKIYIINTVLVGTVILSNIYLSEKIYTINSYIYSSGYEFSENKMRLDFIKLLEFDEFKKNFIKDSGYVNELVFELKLINSNIININIKSKDKETAKKNIEILNNLTLNYLNNLNKNNYIKTRKLFNFLNQKNIILNSNDIQKFIELTDTKYEPAYVIEKGLISDNKNDNLKKLFSILPISLLLTILMHYSMKFNFKNI